MLIDEDALKTYRQSHPYCEMCGSGQGVTVHHIINRSQFRVDHPDFLIALCFKHHRIVQNERRWRGFLAYKKGWRSYDEMLEFAERNYSRFTKGEGDGTVNGD